MSSAEGGTIGDHLLTPTTVARLFASHGLAPRKAAGQNFVIDPNIVRRIVAAADLLAGDTVVEIGPGLGSLTLALAAAVDRVVAIEIDAGLVGALEEVLDGVDNVEVVHADALRTDLGALVGDAPTAKMVANLPYHVATPLVMHAMHDPVIAEAFVMVQREVGERWAAKPGHPLYAGVSCKLALVADVEVAFSIPRTAFLPAPNVDSVMVRLTRRADALEGPDRDRVTALIEAAFAQRRKTLRNNLRRLVDLPVLEAAADDAGVDLSARAETLSLADFLAFDAALESRR